MQIVCMPIMFEGDVSFHTLHGYFAGYSVRGNHLALRYHKPD